ncbi:LOW QUALITY PROTEIN: Gag-pol fusion protein [Phytophthora palmivora]|uniref:Gag-pol fusion protein n=1 Tax=Phytophthora palmivora TaxID=4796 RepID=A0A2P4X821_9STRA|nr:LOW QUALITY PROTEIN: Gag-pol fusion protein [Phytophthora palmivora]
MLTNMFGSVLLVEVCYRPFKNGLMQKMPLHELSGHFALFVVVAVDPLVTTPQWNKFIQCSQTTSQVSFVETMLNEVVSRHGVPERLLSDQGSNFISDLARSLYETLGIKKVSGAAYHPQTQGLVERFNGTLIGMLKMRHNLYLSRVLFAYRTCYHETLDDSACMAVTPCFVWTWPF